MTPGKRRQSAIVDVGGVKVGGTHPIVVQSMTNTDTADPAATATQVRALHAAGSELVRVTVNNEAAAAAVPEIVAQVDVPVIGDFHYNGHLLLTKFPQCAAALAKYRINPGNVGAKRRDETSAPSGATRTSAPSSTSPAPRGSRSASASTGAASTSNSSRR